MRCPHRPHLNASVCAWTSPALLALNRLLSRISDFNALRLSLAISSFVILATCSAVTLPRTISFRSPGFPLSLRFKNSVRISASQRHPPKCQLTCSVFITTVELHQLVHLLLNRYRSLSKDCSGLKSATPAYSDSQAFESPAKAS